MSLLASPVQADRFRYGSKGIVLATSAQCSKHFTRVERKYGIPKHLLMAIANTESGRFHKGLNRVIPWPWTLNIEGKGYYFDNMNEAVSAMKQAQYEGTESIDVGCMQVNIKHHPKAFKGALSGLSPLNNIDYAAKFLRDNFNEMKSWKKAIAAYHSRTPSLGSAYLERVQKRWSDIIVATGGKPLEDTQYLSAAHGVKIHTIPVNVNNSTDQQQATKQASNKKNITPIKPHIASKGKAQGNSTTRTPSRMKIITVSTRTLNNGSEAIQIIPQHQTSDTVTKKPDTHNEPKETSPRRTPRFIFSQ